VVRLDYDQSETIAPALDGVERLFLLSGYTVDMPRQSKALMDRAQKSGVKEPPGAWETFSSVYRRTV